MLAASKAVFVLGAGFSREARFPLQAEILPRILELEVDIMHSPRHAIEIFHPAQERITAFIDRVFGVGTVPLLEDVFTLLDLSIARRETSRGYTWHELDQVRDALKRAVLFVFHQASLDILPKTQDFYDLVGLYLLDRRTAKTAARTISIVSLNWDSLLEDSIYRSIRSLQGLGRADIDYCSYTTPIGESCPHTPSLVQEAAGIANVKIMKLHGSVNWLLCPNCGRLYTGVGGTEDVWELYVRPQSQACPICIRYEVADHEDLTAPRLEPFIITPTFIKIFDNPHIQMTWHNAYLELAEASDIIFIGYSLPESDYHVRALLRRAIRRDARIWVVLSERDEPRQNTPLSLRGMFASSRYRGFFNGYQLSFATEGFRRYFEQVFGHPRLKLRRLMRRRIRRRLSRRRIMLATGQ